MRSLTEVLPSVQTHSRDDKMQLFQILAKELTVSDGFPMLEEGQSYEVWSPHDAYEAAAVLQQLLGKEKQPFKGWMTTGYR